MWVEKGGELSPRQGGTARASPTRTRQGEEGHFWGRELGREEKQADKLEWGWFRAAPASGSQGLCLPEMLHIKQDFTVNEEVACVFVQVLSLATSDLPEMS